MKTAFLSALLLLSLGSAFADDGIVSVMPVPGQRKAMPVDPKLKNPFRGSAFIAVKDKPTNIDDRGVVIPEPEGLRQVQNYVNANPVSSLCWSENPARRSVLIGDTILHVGGNFSPDLVEFGDRFQVKEITQDHVVFEPIGASKYKKDFSITVQIRLKEDLRLKSVPHVPVKPTDQ